MYIYINICLCIYNYIYIYYAKTCIQLLLKQQNLGLQSLVILAIFAGLWDQDPKAARPAGFCCLWADLFMGTPQNGYSNREDNGRPLISGKSRVENWVPWTHKWLLILVVNHQFLVADHVERFPVCHQKKATSNQCDWVATLASFVWTLQQRLQDWIPTSHAKWCCAAKCLDYSRGRLELEGSRLEKSSGIFPWHDLQWLTIVGYTQRYI